MTELYINGNLLDVSEVDIALTAQALTFDKLGSRRGSFSNIFDVAKTNANKAIFDNCDIVTSLTSVPYQRNACQIFIEGVLIVDGGAIILATKENYRLYVTAGNTDFFKAIGSLKLTDVDLSEFDHAYNAVEVIERRETLEGFVYPNIDYGFFEYADPASSTYSFRFFQPSMWAKTILKKAIDALGYTIAGDLLESLTYQSLAVLCRGAVSDLADSLAQYRFTIDYNRLTGSELEKISFPDRVSDTSNLYNANPSAGHFTYAPNVADPLDMRFLISISGRVLTNLPRRFTNSSVWIDLLIYDAAGALLLTLTPTPVIFEDRFYGLFQRYIAPAEGTLKRDINFTYPSTTADRTAFNSLVNGSTDLTGLRFGFQVRTNRDTYGLRYLRFENLEFIINQVPPGGGRIAGPNIPINVRAANVLPAAPTVGDLFLTMLNLEGLIVQVDESTKRVHTSKLDRIAEKKAIAADWSNKIDLTEKPEIGYQLEGFAQKNYYEFNGDDKDNLLEPNAGRGLLVVDNANLIAEQTIFKSKFSPVPVLPVLLNSRTMGRVFTGEKYTFDGFDYGLNGDLKISEFSARLAILAPSEASLQITAAANAINFEVNESALSFEKALNDNYSVVEAVVKNTKVVEALFLLSLSDVQGLDFTRPVYVDYFGDFFYIEQIKQFKINRRQSCFVRLIKLGI